MRFFIIALLVLPLVSSTSAHLTGTFVSLTTPCKDWTTAQWRTTTAEMASMDFNTIIIQESVYDKVSFYDSALGYTYWGNNPIYNILLTANENGLRVHLGLLNDEEAWFKMQLTSKTNISNKLIALRTANTKIASELRTKFGMMPAFAGFYIPQEIDNLRWHANPTAKAALIKDFLIPMGLLHKQISISGFYNPTTDDPQYALPPTYAAFWKDLLVAKINTMWLQDGVGVFKTSYTIITAYFKAIKNVFDARHRRLIGIVEVFNSPSMVRLINQMNAIHSMSSDMVSYEYSALQPLLASYKAWLANS